MYKSTVITFKDIDMANLYQRKLIAGGVRKSDIHMEHVNELFYVWYEREV